MIEFYKTVSSLAFMLLGLWWVVIQLRFRDGAGTSARRRQAYSVLLLFLAPGVMSLLASVNLDLSAIWRTVFTIVAILGFIEVALHFTGGESRRRAADLLRLGGLVVYALIALVALVPSVAYEVQLYPLEAEAFLVTALVVIGVHMVFLEIVTPLEPKGAEA